MHTLRTRPVFFLTVLVALGFLAYIGAMLAGGLLGVNPGIAAMGHFSARSHRVHELTYAFLFGVAGVAMAAQLRDPARNLAAQFMALVPGLAFVLALALGNSLGLLLRPPFVPVLGALTLIALILHPAGPVLTGSFGGTRPSRVMLALVLIAAVPFLAFAAEKVGFQATIADDHAAQGHYGYLAAFSFTAIAVGLLASLRPAGWRLVAWVAGALPPAFAFASLVHPDVASSLPTIWALAAVAWGAAFLVVAELTARADPVARNGAQPAPAPDTNTPGWAQAVGIIGLGLVVLAVVVLFGGGASGGHASPIQHGP